MQTTLLKKELISLVSSLSPREQREVVDFASFLHRRQGEKNGSASESTVLENPPKPVRYDGWAGCLSNVKLSAVDIQHLARDTWGKNFFDQ